MSKRKDQLKALFGGEPSPTQPTTTPHSAPEPRSAPKPAGTETTRSSSGAVKAMGLSLSSITREMEDVRALKESLAKGDRVIEIDTDLIDPSLVRDRLSKEEDGDEAFAALVESVRKNGQQVPVLLRPHPTASGRYQVAYGHRRVRAAARLSRPVRAIVRTLSDDELILAQGKENTERRNLSFIERALFASALIEHGFDRSLVQQALSLHKAEMTRFLQVAEAVPRNVVHAIGPAPKAGRPRWMALAEFLKRDAAQEVAYDELYSNRFAEADSDTRFRLVYDRLARRVKVNADEVSQVQAVKDGNGQPLAHVTLGAKPRFDFDEAARPGFADFVAAKLPELAERFAEERAGKKE